MINSNKKINIITLITSIILLTISLGLQINDLVFEAKNSDFSNDTIGYFLEKFFMSLFSLIAIILLILILLSRIDKFIKFNLNQSVIFIFNLLTLICIIVSLGITLSTTVDRFIFNFIDMGYTWEMTLANSQLITYLLSILFAAIFLFIVLALILIQIIIDIKNKNYPRINLDKLRQSHKAKRRKHLQDKIDKLDE